MNINFVLFTYISLQSMISVEGSESMDPNTSNIISGVLSMIGGIAGAFGAYYVATVQMKKQFKKQDKDRVIELKILKLNETLELINEFSHILQVWRGLMLNVEMRIKEFKEKGIPHIVEASIFYDNEKDEIKKNIHRLIFIKDTLKKNKIFLSGLIDLERIYNSTSEFTESNKKFIYSFNGFKSDDTMLLTRLGQEFDEVTIEISSSYDNLNSEIRRVITLIENSIKELLELE